VHLVGFIVRKNVHDTYEYSHDGMITSLRLGLFLSQQWGDGETNIQHQYINDGLSKATLRGSAAVQQCHFLQRLAHVLVQAMNSGPRVMNLAANRLIC